MSTKRGDTVPDQLELVVETSGAVPRSVDSELPFGFGVLLAAWYLLQELVVFADEVVEKPRDSHNDRDHHNQGDWPQVREEVLAAQRYVFSL